MPWAALAVVDNVQATPDLLEQIVHQIENLDAQELHKSLIEKINAVDSDYFSVGGLLAAVQANKHYQEMGYESFKDYVEKDFAMPYRKVMYLISIYTSLVNSGVKWEQVSEIGWTKLKELASVLTKDNVTYWVDKAKSLTVLQLIEAVKASKTAILNAVEQEEEKSNVSTMTFKVHEDQKLNIQLAIEKAMKEAPTEHKSVAIDAICMNYLAGGKVNMPTGEVSLVAIFKTKLPEEILLAFEEVFPNVNLTVEVNE